MRYAAMLGLLALAACAPTQAPAARDAAREGRDPATGAAEQPAPPPSPPAPDQPAPGAGEAGGAAGDSARIARLEREARALARTGGCGAAAQCRMAPVGSRPCGGPREYLAYCAATTDSARLFAKLDELRRAEEAYNRERGMMSTCEFRQPPRAELVGGSCRAAAEGELRDVVPR